MSRFHKPLALSAVALVALTACTDPARIGQSNDGENTKAGAIIGGIVGAVTGASVSGDGDKAKGAVVGAIVGAGAGAAIGDQLDQQAEDLRRDLDNDAVRIENTGSELLVTLPQDLLFSVGSAALRSDLRRDLGVVAGNLQAYPNSVIQVVGHTDNTGSAEFNQDLSVRRAQAVTSVLVQNGVPTSRLRSIGAGEDQPIATNLTDEGRAQNRRVELVITPTG